MSKIKGKYISIPTDVIEKVKKDISSDKVCVLRYNISDVPHEFVGANLLHPEVLKKSTCCYLMTSGCPEDGLTYAFIVSERIDHDDLDLDPIVFAFNLETGSPEPSGVLTLHGDFKGRTEAITACYVHNKIEDIISTNTTKKMPFSEAPQKLGSAMHWVADKYRKQFVCPKPRYNRKR
ncbi:MAG: hypothetical protein JNL74_05755 [Fibrobacteres bacterium]|nr:hypothetical protein [Fibrobacterota bacterium]